YELVDHFTGSSGRTGVAGQRPEQHILRDLREVRDNGVVVVVPPLHHEVVTARVRVADSRGALRAAQRELEDRLTTVENEQGPPPSGVALTAAWGVPYFHRYVPALADAHLPIDRRASKEQGRTV